MSNCGLQLSKLCSSGLFCTDNWWFHTTLTLSFLKYIIFNRFCQKKCRNHYICYLVDIVLLPGKSEVVILFEEVLGPDFDLTESPFS